MIINDEIVVFCYNIAEQKDMNVISCNVSYLYYAAKYLNLLTYKIK